MSFTQKKNSTKQFDEISTYLLMIHEPKNKPPDIYIILYVPGFHPAIHKQNITLILIKTI